MKWRLLSALLVLGLSAEAHALALKGAPSHTISVAKFNPYRKISLCFIPDPQNQTSMDDFSVDVATCVPNQTGCSGEYCSKSIYCDASWRSTGRTELMNMAYAMTGQGEKVDWTKIRGHDKFIQSHWQNPPNGHCDAIISMGDMNDISDASVGNDPTYSDLTAKQQYEVDTNEIFWNIVKASGIPFLPVIGNHDPQNVYTRLMETTLGFSSLPFYYSREPTRKFEYAIKVPTNSGKSLCIIGMNSSSSHSPTLLVNGTDRQWVQDNVGCGASLPTIIVQHEVIAATACTMDFSGSPSLTAVINDAASTAFMFAGGHYLIPTGNCVIRWEIGTIGSGGLNNARALITMFSDYQEVVRHGQNPPFGSSQKDGAGEYYQIVTIDPRYKTINTHTWSPYWQGHSPEADVAGSINLLNTTVTYDFDTEFP